VNIYIYGSVSFNNEIHKVLDHGNIRFKIDDGEVREVVSLNTLKDLIKEDPHEIFLIDENKIIEDDFISKYFKFLLPKDGIKQSFLDKYGIGDISLRTKQDLVTYIDKRLEATIKKPHVADVKTIEDIFDAFEDDDSKLESKVKKAKNLADDDSES
jgi:hypothetical protein